MRRLKLVLAMVTFAHDVIDSEAVVPLGVGEVVNVWSNVENHANDLPWLKSPVIAINWRSLIKASKWSRGR